MENIFSSKNEMIKYALCNSLSSDNNIRNHSEQLLQQLLGNVNEYLVELVNLLLGELDNVLRISASVQLKNVFKMKLKENVLTNDTVDYLQRNIIILLTKSKEKTEMKNYQIIIKKLLKKKVLSREFLLQINELLSKDNSSLEFFCGVVSAGCVCKSFEFETERKVFNEIYSAFHLKLLNKFLQLGTGQTSDQMSIKCYKSIVKIFTNSSKLSPPIEILNDFDKILQVILTLQISLLDEKLQRGLLNFVYTIYEKYFDVENMEKDAFYYPFFEKIVPAYTAQLCSFFLANINSTTIYPFQFFLTSFNRKVTEIMTQVKNNLGIVLNSMINSFKLTEQELALSEKEFIYFLFDRNREEKNKIILSLLEKICIDNNSRQSVITYLVSQLEAYPPVNDENKTLIDTTLVLIKEILTSKRRKRSKGNDNDNEIFKLVISKYAITNLGIMDSNLLSALDVALVFRCVDFISSYPDEFTAEEIDFILRMFFKGISFQNKVINVICILGLSSLLKQCPSPGQYEGQILPLLKMYLQLVSEIECEQLIWGIENIIDAYPETVKKVVNDLAKEMVNIFKQYITQLSEIDKRRNTNLDNSACSTIDIIISLFKLEKENDSHLDSLVSIVDEIIIFSLSEKGCDVSMLVFERMLAMVDAIVFFYKSIDSNGMLWNYYNLIISSLVKYNGSQPIEGSSYEILQNVTITVFSFIVKGSPMVFNNYLQKTLQILFDVVKISHVKEDDVFCSYALKILITIFEMNFESKNEFLASLLEGIFLFIINELNTCKDTTDYYQLLIQLISVAFAFDPATSLNVINKINQTEFVFEKWTKSIKRMRYFFEEKRSLVGLFSIWLIDINNMPACIRDNLPFLMNLVNELYEKCSHAADEECEESGGSEEDSYSTPSDYSYDDFLVDDKPYHEESDEDYSCDDNKNKKLKTKLEKKSINEVLKGIFLTVKNAYQPYQYNAIVSSFGGNDQFNTFFQKICK